MTNDNICRIPAVIGPALIFGKGQVFNDAIVSGEGRKFGSGQLYIDILSRPTNRWYTGILRILNKII